ncbi:P-loop containing nucleoside triphosphate hydrolase protein [Podospora appendiculata]|uniref:RNA helicase n=1 Tax=Podospora appendiculata TaxID=314037 RepID=A0AAE1CCG5_9PEZI|nr:P-loop containing nucleoside triphosphate hydrolase protein [Podospora appendiculata]
MLGLLEGRNSFGIVPEQSLRAGIENDRVVPALGPSRFHAARAVKRNYKMFETLVVSQFEKLLEATGAWHTDHHEYLSFNVTSQQHLDREIFLFQRAISTAFVLARDKGKTGRLENTLFWNLRNSFVRGDTKGLARELNYAFQSFLLRNQFDEAATDMHLDLTNMCFPSEWFPATRMMKRTVHLHVGPTNSGKTYTALKALESASSGIYAGPLRLLAHEIYTRFTAKGKKCALITGEEQRIPEGADRWFSSCTVEMTPLNQRVDCAVIDEIQMIESEDRGWAWTQAFLGVQAKEVHLCGEERTVGLIQELCKMIGDDCIVHTYKRLNPLQTLNKSLDGSFRNLEKGDAVVSFSRVGLHAIKSGIEEATGRKCAIVYGSLPPETRAQQAALFNDPNNDYDFLAASDAIGMGLNLEIRRVIFETAQKFDGVAHRNLSVPEVKQIGGRAGRYRTASHAIASDSALSGDAATSASTSPLAAAAEAATPGFVTTLDPEDLSTIRNAFRNEAKPIRTAGLKPPTFLLERFYSYFPDRTPFSFVISRLWEMAKLDPQFHLCNFRESLEIAQHIQSFDMSIQDRCIFLTAPGSPRDPMHAKVLKALARCVAEMTGGHLLDIPEIDIEVLDLDINNMPITREQYLVRLESLHKSITLYLWLSYRYQGIFQSQKLAFHVKAIVEEKITNHLDNIGFEAERREKRRKEARMRAEKHRRKEEALLGPEAVEEEADHIITGPGQWAEEGHGEPLFEDLDEVKTIHVEAPGG